MSITNEAVLKKMIHEIQQAMTNDNNDSIREHVRAVQSLCDLILDSNADRIPNKLNEELERKQMMGMLAQKQAASPNQLKKATNTDYEEANGDSIFDF